ncbi:hypothetical protein BKA61DRAFT_618459 [Leptodontidium sp. MPI-SDFR-AT-0119]|nr:hypothetical protein BKA61DRAFT_618459 [Leptodontidium sp. MPI-SDFR-AT-0119]
MQFLKNIHSVVNYALSLLQLVQNREVGWRTLNRKTGKYEREQQPLLKKLKLLLLFNPITEWIDRTHLLRLWIYEKTIAAGRREASKASSHQIKAFVDFYHINMEEFQPSKLSEYSTFDDFFVRQHAVGSRPIFAESDPSKAVVVADSRVVVYPSVSQAQALWIKGKNFTIGNLILDFERAMVWAEGGVASFRLSPQDCPETKCPETRNERKGQPTSARGQGVRKCGVSHREISSPSLGLIGYCIRPN